MTRSKLLGRFGGNQGGVGGELGAQKQQSKVNVSSDFDLINSSIYRFIEIFVEIRPCQQKGDTDIPNIMRLCLLDLEDKAQNPDNHSVKTYLGLMQVHFCLT